MLQDIRLVNFRSYIDSTFSFSPHVTVIVGPNGIGKTNIVEAILYVYKGGSFRAGDTDVVHHDAEWSRIEGVIQENKRTVKIKKTSPTRAEKTFIFQNEQHKRLGVKHSLPVVLFEPDHLRLLRGSPARRRDYLDQLIESITPSYKTIRSRYNRTLAQRNALLKSKSPDDQLFVWNIRLAELGGIIASERQSIIAGINSEITDIYSSMASKKSSVALSYQSSVNIGDYANNLISKLQASVHLDKLRGFTSHGPHRDELIVSLNDKPAITTASRGETRTILLALKVFELHTLQCKYPSTPPLLLLDDVFSELDELRQKSLTKYLKTFQTVITSTEALKHHDTIKELIINL